MLDPSGTRVRAGLRLLRPQGRVRRARGIRHHARRRPLGRSGVAPGSRGHGLRPEGTGGGCSAHGAHGGALRLRRRRAVRGRAHVRSRRALLDPGAPRPPRRRGAGRVCPHLPGHVPRPAHGLQLRRHGLRCPPRPLPRHGQRERRRRVQPGLGGSRSLAAGRVDGRDVDSLLPAALQRPGRAAVGAERPALDPLQERGRLLGAGPAYRAGVGVTLRGALRHRRDRAHEPDRGPPLRGRRIYRDGHRQPGRPLRRRAQPGGAGRRGPEDGAGAEPDPGGDRNPRLRAGGGGSRGGQPDGLRGAVRGAAPVLHRGRGAAQRPHAQLLLLEAHRRAPAPLGRR